MNLGGARGDPGARDRSGALRDVSVMDVVGRDRCGKDLGVSCFLANLDDKLEALHHGVHEVRLGGNAWFHEHHLRHAVGLRVFGAGLGWNDDGEGALAECEDVARCPHVNAEIRIMTERAGMMHERFVHRSTNGTPFG